MIIALDGPAASGKGTLARALAAHYRLPHLDTGLLYRAVGAAALESGTDLADEPALGALAAALDIQAMVPEALRSGAIGEAASRAASLAQVRSALLKLQQDFARQPGGAVLDGRDIGTVIAPDADVKIFVTATAQARAQRRHNELLQRGESVTFDDVLADIIKRDRRDSERSSAPLIAAPDAVQLDNTRLDRDASIEAVLAIVAEKTGVSQ